LHSHRVVDDLPPDGVDQAGVDSVSEGVGDSIGDEIPFAQQVPRWGVGGALHLARSKDGGTSWVGAGSLNAGADVPGTSGVFAPEVSVDAAGVVHVVWHSPGSSTIMYTRSTDGGETFTSPKAVVTGVSGLTSPPLPKTGTWAEFPNAKFRVLTLATGCAVGNRFLVAWADMREGYSRIYYHYSNDAGATWAPSAGQPLWPSLSPASAVQQFHPQIIADGKRLRGDVASSGSGESARSFVAEPQPGVDRGRGIGPPGAAPARRGELVQLAAIATDRADGHVAVDVDLEEAGAAVGGAEEPAGAGDAPAKAAHVGSTSNRERVLGSREHERNGSFWPRRPA